MSDIFDATSKALATTVNMRLLRNNLISSNIANAETPHFHAKKIDFEEALQRALDTDSEKRQSPTLNTLAIRPDIYDNPEGAVNNDGNTVDLEKEMSNLAENTILYKSALQLINKKMAALKYVAGDGR